MISAVTETIRKRVFRATIANRLLQGADTRVVPSHTLSICRSDKSRVAGVQTRKGSFYQNKQSIIFVISQTFSNIRPKESLDRHLNEI